MIRMLKHVKLCEKSEPLLIFLHSCFSNFFPHLEAYFFLLFQIFDLSPGSFPSLLVPCTYSFISLCIAFTFPFIWVWSQNRGKSEGYEKWNEKYTGTNCEGKETKTQINDLEQKEEINIQPEQKEEIRIQKKWGEA